MRHLSLKEKAYHIIRQKLMAMEFEPGSRIREDFLAEEISMSRTPVREAINHLMAEGLINYIPRRGLFFNKIKKDEIKDLLEVREALEVLAVGKCIEKISPKQVMNLEKILDEIRLALKEKKYVRCNELDSVFHKEIAKVSRNKKLIDFCTDVEDWMHIARAMEKKTHTKNKIEISLEEHEAILECIKNKDKRGAEVAICNNIMSMKRNLGI